MYNFKITWQGTIADVLFTEEIEAETLVQAVNEFYSVYKHEKNIVKIKRCEIKKPLPENVKIGMIMGVLITVLIVLIGFMILMFYMGIN